MVITNNNVTTESTLRGSTYKFIKRMLIEI